MITYIFTLLKVTKNGCRMIMCIALLIPHGQNRMRTSVANHINYIIWYCNIIYYMILIYYLQYIKPKSTRCAASPTVFVFDSK